MKTLYSCLFILTLFTSCDDSSTTTTTISNNRDLFNRTTAELPGFSENPYDEAGWIHNELFETYYENTATPTSLNEVISEMKSLADSNFNFNAIKSSTYHPVSAERIQFLLDHKDTCLTTIIASSSLSCSAKLNFISFVSSLNEKFAEESSCDALFDFVVAYEKTVLDNAAFTEKDKRILLTTTSIARHTVYLAKKKPKKNTNPDWTILILHIAAAVDGAEYGTAESITEALVVGIVSN